MKRWISGILCIVMLISMLPAEAMATMWETEPAIAEMIETERTETVTTAATEQTTAALVTTSVTEAETLPAESSPEETEIATEPVLKDVVPAIPEETETATEPVLKDVVPAIPEETETATEPVPEETEEAEEPEVPVQEYTEPTVPTEFAEAVSAAAAMVSGTTGTVSWEITEDGILRLSGSGSVQNYSENSPAPWAEYADSITGLELGSGITALGDYAFANLTAIGELRIPETVTQLGKKTFANCSGLQKLIFPANGCDVSTLGGAYSFERSSNIQEIVLYGQGKPVRFRIIQIIQFVFARMSVERNDFVPDF